MIPPLQSPNLPLAIQNFHDPCRARCLALTKPIDCLPKAQATVAHVSSRFRLLIFRFTKRSGDLSVGAVRLMSVYGNSVSVVTVPPGVAQTYGGSEVSGSVASFFSSVISVQ